ncbi:unnamed protein product [Cuscuta europaea]|uniref:Uncharacterized protein n=1 Tax=Cuscuta europaea TaxID=41803 RepID=A0A9P1EBQ6_CUSEU|nr:unnamed protein product [Cuscuta europaea]
MVSRHPMFSDVVWEIETLHAIPRFHIRNIQSLLHLIKQTIHQSRKKLFITYIRLNIAKEEFRRDNNIEDIFIKHPDGVYGPGTSGQQTLTSPTQAHQVR